MTKDLDKDIISLMSDGQPRSAGMIVSGLGHTPPYTRGVPKSTYDKIHEAIRSLAKFGILTEVEPVKNSRGGWVSRWILTEG